MWKKMMGNEIRKVRLILIKKFGFYLKYIRKPWSFKQSSVMMLLKFFLQLLYGRWIVMGQK